MVRGFIWDRLRAASPGGLRRWVKNQNWFIPISTRLFGNSVYSRSYYTDLERLETRTCRVIGAWIADHMQPKRVIDIGCGSGLLLNELKQRGVAVFGIDLSAQAVSMAREKGIPVDQLDLTKHSGAMPGGSFDLAITTEVAEHLEERFARRFVELVCSAANRVYMTAAEPQPDAGPGLYHFNEQPNEYWIKLMAERSFVLHEQLTNDARAHLDEAKVIRYLARPMIFEQQLP